MVEDPDIVTMLFTDIEGSTLLWEQQSDRMKVALSRHDEILRHAVESNHGTVVKTMGDGMHAAFADPLDALAATVALQLALANAEGTNGISLKVRCGLHLGAVERRDQDYFGAPVNRTARIMSAAHGGQVIVSQAVTDQVADRLPQSISLRDLGAVRLKDLARPERVYQVLHPSLRQDFPALHSLEATPNNLPQQTTSFVGRELALDEIRALLKSTRLLTLVGAGGLGKTRLSLQLGAEVLDDFPDGVWFIELAPIADASLVAQTAASVLGVKEEPGRPVEEALAAFASDRRLLLILDNCEHLTQACADLATRLLQSGPAAKILASSREVLRVAGETTYPLAPLAIPDSETESQVAALTRCEAVRLFLDRAHAVQTTFRITEQNAMAVTEICRRLEGIPLALELAAARIRTLGVAQIASRLSDRLGILTGGYRTALPRQQTLRACIDWSFDLLTEREQALFRRLSVFAGGWTLDAAASVGAGGEFEKSEVLDLLINLVEKSLVTVEACYERYQLLETVRQYAQERLDQTLEAEQVHRQHLAYYATLAEEAIPELVGPKPGKCLARLEPEQKNILAAQAWIGRDERDGELTLALAVATVYLWTHRGSIAVGYRITVESLQRPHAQRRTLARCRALSGAGQLAVQLGLLREAQGHAEEGLAIALELGDKGRIAMVHQVLGMTLSEQGDRNAALRHFEEALVLTREVGPPRRFAAALQNLGQWHREGGNLDAAESLLIQSLEISRGEGDRNVNTASAMTNIAGLSIRRGTYERARVMLFEATEIAEETGSRYAGGLVLEGAAELAAGLEDWTRAARLLGALKSLSVQTGTHRDGSLEANVRKAMGAVAFAAAEADGKTLTYEAAIAEARAWLVAIAPAAAQALEESGLSETHRAATS